MSKKKNELPPSAGAVLSKMRTLPVDPTDNYGSDTAREFNNKHDALFKGLTYAVGIMIAQRDGDSLQLMDAGLLGICGYIREAMQRHGIVVQPDAKARQ